MEENLTKEELMTTRPYRPSDRNFILATWLRCLYYDSDYYSEMDKDEFMAHYADMLKIFVEREMIHINVACLREDSDVILGYAAYHTVNNITALDFVYIKSAWRKIGIAKSLVPCGVSACTNLTRLGKRLKPKSWDFNPFLL